MSESTILVVDDDDTSRYFKAHVLRRAGYTVTEATGGYDALAMIRARAPALVVLDVKLPDISGIVVCERVKAENASVLVLQTSAAFTSSEHRTTALSGGADSYLVEPIEPAELLAVVGAMFRLHRAELELQKQNETLEHKVAQRTREIEEVNRRLLEETRQRAEIEEALRHAQKLDALGQLTGGMAHDFNNLLTVVLGNLELLERGIREWDQTKQPRLLRFASLALLAVRDCSRLTHQLLAFARRDALRFAVIDVNFAIHRFEPLLRRAAGERVSLDFNLSADLWRCRADSGQLEAALLNLVVNARDAMPQGGAVRIVTANAEVGNGETGALAMLEPGEYVQVTVADAGVGMAPDILAHVFEPFFTTKDVGKGSGLGLSQVYGFVKQGGGGVDIQTAPGQGTAVHLYLPRAEGMVSIRDSDRTQDDAPRGSERILVVEDNALVLDFVAQTIRDLGYDVIVATNGHRALEILRSSEPIALLFSDVVMPNQVSGIDLARQARRLRPDLRILLTSGYSATVGAADPVAGEFQFIAKPYAVADLALRLRSVLAGDAPAPEVEQ